MVLNEFIGMRLKEARIKYNHHGKQTIKEVADSKDVPLPLSTISAMENGYYVSATADDNYYNLYFTITLKGNALGDVINLRNERPGESSSIYNFTIDRLPRVEYDSGEDSSYGYARWKGPGVGGMTMDLDIYFNPVR